MLNNYTKYLNENVWAIFDYFFYFEYHKTCRNLTKSLGFHDDILVELGKDFIKICNTSNCCNTAGVSALNIMFLIYFNFH